MMFVTAYHNSTNEIIFQRLLADDEIMDPLVFANQVAEMFCTTLAKSDGYIPSGCGDFTIEFAEQPLTAVDQGTGSENGIYIVEATGAPTTDYENADTIDGVTLSTGDRILFNCWSSTDYFLEDE